MWGKFFSFLHNNSFTARFFDCIFQHERIFGKKATSSMCSVCVWMLMETWNPFWSEKIIEQCQLSQSAEKKMILTMNIEIVNETNRCKAHEQKILTEIFKQKTQNWKNELNKNVNKKKMKNKIPNHHNDKWLLQCWLCKPRTNIKQNWLYLTSNIHFTKYFWMRD